MQGASPLVSSVLLVVAVMVSTYIVMGVLSPNLQRYREIAAMDSAKNVLLSADRAIRELLHEAPKGKRIVTLQAPRRKIPHISGGRSNSIHN